MSDWSFYERGFSLFPLTPRTKRPAVEWEKYQTSRATPEQIAAWAAHNWNIGIATGAVSGCVVLDTDSLLARVAAEERGIPDTLTLATPRGTHFVFQHPGWPVQNRAGRGWTVVDRTQVDTHGQDGWDIRGDGGYIVGPGSHYVPTAAELAEGKVEGHYAIERDLPIAPAPAWLLDLLSPRERKPNVPPKMAERTSEYGRAALNAEMRVLLDCVPGDGRANTQINASAFAIGQLVAGGEITSEEGWGALEEALAVLGVADEEKATGTLERGWEAGLAAPRGVEHGEPVPPPIETLGRRDAVARAPDGPPPPPPDDSEPLLTVALGPNDRTVSRGRLILTHEMPDYFAGAYFVERQEVAFVLGRGVLKQTAFNTWFGGNSFPTSVDGAQKTRSAWEAFRENPGWSCPIVYDMCFRPDKTPGVVIPIEGRLFINTYEPIQTKRIKGDPSRWLDFLARLLPDERDRQILTSYMCAIVQNPGRKFQWWPVLQGAEGNGKTLILTALTHAVGQRYTHLPNPEAMGKTGNQFNSWVQGNLLVGIEEIFISDQRHILETFKPLVTNKRTGVEGKGKDQTTGDNFANGVMLTNYTGGVPVNADMRRYAMLWCAQQCAEDIERDGMGGAYFPDLYDWMHGRGKYEGMGEDYGLSVVNEWLQTTAPVAEFNPAGLCQRAPRTSSTAAAIRESLGLLEQEVQEAIEEQRPGFRGDWISSHALRTLFQSLRQTIGPKRYRTLVGSLGYVLHPSLPDGRASGGLSDGSRPRLYVRKDSPDVKLPSEEAVAAYEQAQRAPSDHSENNVIPFRPR